MYDFIRERVHDVGLTAKPPGQEEALTALLQAKAGYDLGRTNVKP